MRRFVAPLIVAPLIVAMAFPSASLVAQTAAPGAAKSSVPRASDGKPDLTGVWQAGSTARGSWEEANSGTGLGGTGKNPSAPAVLSASDRPATAEKAPYQPWAAQRVLESYKNRGVDDPAASACRPAFPEPPSWGSTRPKSSRPRNKS